MKLSVIYVYPAFVPLYDDYASRFVGTYCVNRCDVPHTLHVVSNGGPPSSTMTGVFSRIHVEWHVHDNSGYDIGAFQMLSKLIPGEVAVYLGSSTYIRGPGWLKRISDSFDKHGEALYGTMSNEGCDPAGVLPHLRTTGFWTTTDLMNRHPFRVTSPEQRYGYEFGPDGLTQWVLKSGLDAYLVDWESEYPRPRWLEARNSYHFGDQSGLIFGDKLTDKPFYG